MICSVLLSFSEKVQGFDEEKDLSELVKKNYVIIDRAFLIKFDLGSNYTANSSFPHNLRYTIRSKFLVFWNNRRTRMANYVPLEENIHRRREILIVKYYIDKAITDVYSEVPHCKRTNIRLSMHPIPKSKDLLKSPVSLQWAFPLTSIFIMVMPALAHRIGVQKEFNHRVKCDENFSIFYGNALQPFVYLFI